LRQRQFLLRMFQLALATERTSHMSVRQRARGTTCEGCYSPDIALFHRSRRNRLDVGRCRDCGLVSVIRKPSAEELFRLYDSTRDYEGYLAAQNVDGLRQRQSDALMRIRLLLPSDAGKLNLFDVGAGQGDFLNRARTSGFEVYGNEISEPAARLCAERHGIQLTRKDLRDVADSGSFDALTMWCVIAHVQDPHELLEHSLRVLKPGGILYLHTPRWCLIDSVGLAAARCTGGLLSQIIDRRVNAAHLRLYTAANMTKMILSAGFEVVSVTPTIGYSLRTKAYFGGMGIPQWLHRPLSYPADRLIERGLFVRNILDVYARKPVVSGLPSGY
jgi:2-polyprenyl-3-methyl-5-hydroxy-6-metoxy-1,4-benzoquinol methylase